MPPRVIQVQTQAGDPVFSGGTKIVPFSQSVSVQAPGGHTGFIWNRPVSILTISATGEEQVIPVEDVTRRVQFSLLGVAVAWALLLWIISMISKRSNTND
jgi:hypothetical protein